MVNMHLGRKEHDAATAAADESDKEKYAGPTDENGDVEVGGQDPLHRKLKGRRKFLFLVLRFLEYIACA